MFRSLAGMRISAAALNAIGISLINMPRPYVPAAISVITLVSASASRCAAHALRSHNASAINTTISTTVIHGAQGLIARSSDRGGVIVAVVDRQRSRPFHCG